MKTWLMILLFVIVAIGVVRGAAYFALRIAHSQQQQAASYPTPPTAP